MQSQIGQCRPAAEMNILKVSGRLKELTVLFFPSVSCQRFPTQMAMWEEQGERTSFNFLFKISLPWRRQELFWSFCFLRVIFFVSAPLWNLKDGSFQKNVRITGQKYSRMMSTTCVCSVLVKDITHHIVMPAVFHPHQKMLFNLRLHRMRKPWGSDTHPISNRLIWNKGPKWHQPCLCPSSWDVRYDW